MTGIQPVIRRRRFQAGPVRGLALLCMAGALAGCSMRAAPTVVLFGAYFPDWLLLSLCAIGVAIAAYAAIGLAGLAHATPFPLFTCLAVGILVAGTLDLLWFDR